MLGAFRLNGSLTLVRWLIIWDDGKKQRKREIFFIFLIFILLLGCVTRIHKCTFHIIYLPSFLERICVFGTNYKWLQGRYHGLHDINITHVTMKFHTALLRGCVFTQFITIWNHFFLFILSYDCLRDFFYIAKKVL